MASDDAPLPPPVWPAGLVAYKRTAEFTEITVPAALTRAHSTKAGTWARLHVLDGQLRFRDEIGGDARELGPGVHEVIHPQRPHAVTPLGTVRFYVEFLKAGEG